MSASIIYRFNSLLRLFLVSGVLLACSFQTAVAQDDPEKWPSSLDEAVAELVSGISDTDKNTLCDTKKKDLIQYHMGWGMGIRNGYGLWKGNDALLRSACGGELCHPDEASMIIIEHVWETLQKEYCGRRQQ